MDNGLLITLICVLGGGFVVILNEMNKKKSSKAKEMLESGSVVIDVRTPEEFKSGHYMNSINIPLDKIESSLDKIRSYDNGIVIVCASGMRSAKAKSILAKNNIESTNGVSWKNL